LVYDTIRNEKCQLEARRFTTFRVKDLDFEIFKVCKY